jgi:hypothetical protein
MPVDPQHAGVEHEQALQQPGMMSPPGPDRQNVWPSTK